MCKCVNGVAFAGFVSYTVDRIEFFPILISFKKTTSSRWLGLFMIWFEGSDDTSSNTALLNLVKSRMKYKYTSETLFYFQQMISIDLISFNLFPRSRPIVTLDAIYPTAVYPYWNSCSRARINRIPQTDIFVGSMSSAFIVCERFGLWRTGVCVSLYKENNHFRHSQLQRHSYYNKTSFTRTSVFINREG